MKKKFGRLILLNGLICLADIAVFSNSLLGVRISGAGALQSAFGITVIFMSILVFFVGNLLILKNGEKRIELKTMPESLADCAETVAQCQKVKTFADDFAILLAQIERLKRKNAAIDNILLQKFSPTEMSYAKFKGAITELEKLFLLNTKSVLNRINGFDEDEYRYIQRTMQLNRGVPGGVMRDKIHIYQEYIGYVKQGIENNEQLILKLDKILLEVSKYDTLEAGELSNMSAFQEIDELINNAKHYR